MNEKINVAVIGTGMYVCGKGGDTFGTVLPAILQLYQEGHIGEIAVASKHKTSFDEFYQRFKQLTKQMHVNASLKRYPVNETVDERAYQQAILDLPEPGAVIVAVPDHLHKEIIKFAIMNKKHVFVVKPFVPLLKDAYELVKLADKYGIYGAVDFHKRWDAANLKIRQAIESNIIGELLYFHVEFSQRKVIPSNAFSHWVNQTSIFQYLGVHYADMIYFLTGKKPVKVMAIGQKKWLNNKMKLNVYDAIQTIIEWEGNFSSSILTNWVDPNQNDAMSQQAIKLIGTNGRIESNQTNRGLHMVIDSQGEITTNPYFCEPFINYYEERQIEYKGYGIDSFRQFFSDVKKIITAANKPSDFEKTRPTFRQSLVSTSILEAVHLSLENNNSWISIDEEINKINLKTK